MTLTLYQCDDIYLCVPDPYYVVIRNNLYYKTGLVDWHWNQKYNALLGILLLYQKVMSSVIDRAKSGINRLVYL